MDRRSFLIGSAATLGGCVASPPMRFRSFQSDRISVVTRGTGPDVLLVPGLGSSRQVWTDLLQRVPGYRYHLVQLNGFAGYPALGNASGPVIASAISELARYIRQARLDRPALVGHSMGGSVALGLAARHDLVGKVMVVDMLPFLGILFGPPGTTAETVSPTADALMAASLAATPEARQRTVAANIGTMVKAGPLRDQATADALASDRQVTASAYRELIVTDLRPELPNIRVPITVLYVKTPNVPLTAEQFDELYRASYAGVPAVRLKRIPDSLHFIMHDQPERFAAEMRMFLIS